MNIRAAALEYLEDVGREPTVAQALGLRRGQSGSSKDIASSRLFPPSESATKARAWWHDIDLHKTNGDGNIILVCEWDRPPPGFYVLAVPKSWLREHQESFAQVGGKLRLHLSAEPGELFIDRRYGSANLNLGEFQVECRDGREPPHP